MSMHAERHAEAVDAIAAKGKREVNKVAMSLAIKEDEEELARHAQAYFMEAAAMRHAAHLENIAAKGSKEVHKVASAVAKKEVETLIKRVNQDSSMLAAQDRREATLAAKAAKGTAEVNKVFRAYLDGKAADEFSTGLRKEAHDSSMQAAKERRAKKLDKIAAKGAAEVRKVGKVTGKSIGARSASKAVAGGPPSPDSVMAPAEVQEELLATGDDVAPELAPELAPKPEPPRAFDARAAALTLAIMRHGNVPNAEMLLAITPDALEAVARKYSIAIPQAPALAQVGA